MRTIKAADLARQLGIPIRTMSNICKSHPEFVELGPYGDYFIRLDKLAEQPGFDLIAALMLPTQTWVKAIDVARAAKISRRTVNNWCRTRSKFAIRLGRTWYINWNEWEAPSGRLGNTPTER